MLAVVQAAAPQDSPALRGRTCYQQGRLECARDELTRAAADEAAPAWVLSLLGRAHMGLKEYAGAQEVWERLLATAPRFRDVYFDLADVYLARQRREQAILLLQEGRRRWPEDVEFLNALGVLFFAKGEEKRAITAFEEAIERAPDDPVGYLNAGKAYEKRYNDSVHWDKLRKQFVSDTDAHTRALAAFRRCAELGGPLATEARARLAPLQGKR